MQYSNYQARIEINSEFIEQVKKLFHNRPVKITVEIDYEPKSQKEIWRRLELLQKKYPPKVISKDIDLSALANEVNL